MLIKYLPIFITASSFFIAIAFHLVYKALLLKPSLMAALCSSLISFVCFKLLPFPESVTQETIAQAPYSAMIFAFGSGLVLALFVGYLMKHAPNLFGK